MFRFMFVRSRGWQEILILVAAGITLGRTPGSHAAAGDQSGKPHHALLPDGNGALAGRSPAQRLDVRVADGVLDIVADGNELRLRLHEDGGIKQQVANLRVGIGYSVALRAPAPGVARVKVVASGTLRAKSEPFGDGIRFDDGAGVAVLRFGPLSARAGDARDIPARWDVHPDGTRVAPKHRPRPPGRPPRTWPPALARSGAGT